MNRASPPPREGPLVGLKVVELGGIGPAPFACMLLSDLGAEIVRVDRIGGSRLPIHREVEKNLLLRGRRSIALDLKQAAAREALIRGVADSDVLIDPFRPGTAERLGVGPEECCERNPRLVYARMTGWGQSGALSEVAGHDLNYLALSGALAANGERESPPAPPLPNVGDFGAGGAMLAYGIMAALFERQRSGQGQVIDVAIIDGLAAMFSNVVSYMNMGLWNEQREANVLDGGAHYYSCYETSDGRFISIAAVEPQFYASLLLLLRLDPAEWPQHDQQQWPVLKGRMAKIFRGDTLASWCELLEGTDACFAPVLPMSEAQSHPHLTDRGVYSEIDGVRQAAPVPRFERTPGRISRPPVSPGQDTAAVLGDWGYATREIEEMRAAGAAAQVESVGTGRGAAPNL